MIHNNLFDKYELIENETPLLFNHTTQFKCKHKESGEIFSAI
jgi:hypothetical protein